MVDTAKTNSVKEHAKALVLQWQNSLCLSTGHITKTDIKRLEKIMYEALTFHLKRKYE